MAFNVAFVSPEVVPFAKTGGLADVAGSLPPALERLGCNVSIFMPLYREVLEKGMELKPTGVVVEILVGEKRISGALMKGSIGKVPVYLLKRDEFYDRSCLYGTSEGDYFDNLERFQFFSRGVIEAIKALGLAPDIIHCNDWQTGLIPAYLKDVGKDSLPGVKTLFTIHNIAYQGIFPPRDFAGTGLTPGVFNVEGLEFWGNMSLLKAGIVYSDIVTTVSEQYSREIQTPQFGYGLEGVLRSRRSSLFGVLNGVDYSEWDPSTDPLIPSNYSADDFSGKARCKAALIKEYSLKLKPGTPVIGIISRLADQKGFDILGRAMKELMGQGLAVVVLGTGEKKYHDLFEKLSRQYPERLGVKITFDNALAHLIEAGSDMFCMPSKYEPCGLNQFYSLRYGTIPIVRATGGLEDTVIDYAGGKGNGFKFTDYTPEALVAKIKEAVSVYVDKPAWKELQKKAMAEDFSWDRSARRYIELYGLAKGSRSRSSR